MTAHLLFAAMTFLGGETPPPPTPPAPIIRTAAPVQGAHDGVPMAPQTPVTVIVDGAPMTTDSDTIERLLRPATAEELEYHARLLREVCEIRPWIPSCDGLGDPEEDRLDEPDRGFGEEAAEADPAFDHR